MTDLDGKRVFVAGGTGDVGEGIVRALLARGASVIVSSRAPDKADRLRAALEDTSRLGFVEGEVGDGAGALAMANTVGLGGPLHGAIASLGGWWQGRSLVDVDAATWGRVLADNLTSHYAVARAFAPLLRESGGTYIQILGGAADFPVPGSSLVSITAAGVAMMGRVLDAESGDSFRVRQIVITTFVATRSRPAGAHTAVTADEIGAFAAHLIADTKTATPLVSRLPAVKHGAGDQRS